MTTYPILLPSYTFTSFIFSLRTVVASSQSPFTLQSQKILHPGQRWHASIGLPMMVRDQAEDWINFLFSLDGSTGTFLMGDAAYLAQGRRGATAVSSLYVFGGGQTGSSLMVSGFENSLTNALKAGDYFQIGTDANARLYRLIENTSSDGSGHATLSFRPPLRLSPANGSTVYLTNPQGIFRLLSDDLSYSINADRHYGLSFEAEEAL